VAARAERGSSSDGFLAGFVVGGVVFGALGFLFAPQLSRSLLGARRARRLAPLPIRCLLACALGLRRLPPPLPLSSTPLTAASSPPPLPSSPRTGEDQRLKLPRFLEEEGSKDPEATKQDLIDKIAQLNASIDEVASQLRSKDSTAVPEAEPVS
jgi:hypothetical protein